MLWNCAAVPEGFAVWFCSVVLLCGCEDSEDSEDSGFCPLRIMWCAPEHFKSSQSLVKWAFASLLLLCGTILVLK